MYRIRHAFRVYASILCVALSFMGSTPVFAAAATHFSVTAPATAIKGAPFTITVTAQDGSNTTDTTYAGTVHFTSSACCGGVALPADSTLPVGTGTGQFSVTIGGTGPFTITATDTVNSGITGTTSSILVTDINNTAINPTPGATLLFPYFEVDPNSSTGRDTVLSLQNNSATAILNHVTVWTDLGVPVLTFNIYLTGYDVESIDLYDVFVNGDLPATASAGQDPSDQISPKGYDSQDINFASCTGQLPYQPGILQTSYRNGLRAALSGHAAAFLGNQCSGFNHGDTILRGYVTVDTINNCTQRMPTDPGYISSDITFQNVMSGEYFLFQASNALMHSDAAVAVHADYSDPYFSTAGNYTFYGSIDFSPWDATDHRQPLPNTWAVDAQSAGMELIVWRDIKIPPTTPRTFACTQPVPPSSGLPLGQEAAFSFDNQEQPQAIPAGTPFGLATQRVALGSAKFPLPGKPGWVYLGLSYQNLTVSAANAPADVQADQAYVTVLQYPESKATSTGAGAIAIDSGQAARHTHPAD